MTTWKAAILIALGLFGASASFLVVGFTYTVVRGATLFAGPDGSPDWLAFANLGGFACFAFVMFFLHRDSIVKFAEQLQKERDVFRELAATAQLSSDARYRDFIALVGGQHGETVRMLSELSAKASDIKDAVRAKPNA